MPDEALLAGMAVGDEGAGIAFVRRYQHRVFGLALAILGDPGLAEDVAQETFVRAWRHASVFDARRGSAPTWLLAIARNLAIDCMRVRRALPRDPDDALWLERASLDRPPEETALGADTARRLGRALAAIPAEQRRAVLLAAVHGRSAREIAEIESIPLGTAKSRIRSGLARLRDAVSTEEVW